MPLALPTPIAAYFDAANAHDGEAFLALLTEDALVIDEGEEYRGLAAIKEWKTRTTAKYRPSFEPTEITESAGQTIVTAKVSGDFPGSPLPLCFRFTLQNDKIAVLHIEV